MRNIRDQKTIDWCEELEGLKYEHKFNHGTLNAYNKHKCRCEYCSEAKSISERRSELRAMLRGRVMLGGGV